MATPLCEWCLALSGRFQAARECCQIRLLATMPRHARAAAYAGAGVVDGKTLREKVQIEWHRQNESRLARGRAALDFIKQSLKGTTA